MREITRHNMKSIDIIKKLNDSMIDKKYGLLAATINNKNYYYGNQGNILICGQPGSGKAESCILTYNRTWIENGDTDILYIDSNGDEAIKLIPYAKANGYNVHILNFRDLNKSQTWNPLSLPYKLYKDDLKEVSYILINELAENLCSKEDDEIFSEISKSLFVTSALTLFEYATEDEINLISLINFVNDNWKPNHIGGEAPLKSFLEILPEASLIRCGLAQFLVMPNLLTVFVSEFNKRIDNIIKCQDLSCFCYSNPDIDIYDYDNSGKNALFVIMPNNTSSCNPLIGSFVGQFIKYASLAAYHSIDHKFNRQLSITLEGLEELGKYIYGLPNLISNSVSKNIRYMTVVQSMDQLKLTFGEEEKEKILDDSIMLVLFKSSGMDTVRYSTQMLNDKEANQTTSLDCMKNKLNNLKVGEALVCLEGIRYVTVFPKYSNIFETNKKRYVFKEDTRAETIKVFSLERMLTNKMLYNEELY